MLCELDIEKTYDNINWGFLDHMIKRISFKNKWCKLINSCITAILFTVMVNGELSSFFQDIQSVETM